MSIDEQVMMEGLVKILIFEKTTVLQKRVNFVKKITRGKKQPIFNRFFFLIKIK